MEFATRIINLHDCGGVVQVKMCWTNWGMISFNGAVQKGAYILNTSVIMSELIQAPKVRQSQTAGLLVGHKKTNGAAQDSKTFGAGE